MARAKATEVKKTNEKQPAAEWVSLASLVPWKKNPRRNAAAIPKVKASLLKFGWGRTLVARRETRELIAGHTTHAAALELGWTEGPCRFVDLSEAEAHALAVADNKTGEFSEWDDAKLAEVLAEVKAHDASSLVATSFSALDLDGLVAKMAPMPSGLPDAGAFGRDTSDDGAERGRRASASSEAPRDARAVDFLTAPPQVDGVSAQDEIEDAANAEEPAPAVAASEFVDGWINFAVRVMPEQDEAIMAAIRRAKQAYRVTTSGDALTAICRAYLGETEHAASKRDKAD